MTLAVSSALFGWSARYGINPRIGGRPTFARNSAGLFTTQEGELNPAIINTPRFDWATVSGERRKVLTLEMARTNKILYAEQFDNAAWTKDGTTIVPNDAIAPDGTLTAERVVETAANAEHRVYQASTVAAGDASWSIFAKAGERSWVSIRSSGVSGLVANFDLVNGVVGTSNTPATITALGGGWYRCTMWATTATVNDFITVNLGNTDTGTGTSYAYAGDITKGIYLWGGMLEEGKRPTAYIQTTSAVATRAVDSHYWNFPPVPQALMAYVKLVEGGSIALTGARVLEMGATPSGSPRFFVQQNTTYQVFHQNVNGSVSATVSGTPVVGDTVELVAILQSDGKVRLLQSINGAAVTDSGLSGAVALVPAWGAPRLWLNAVEAAIAGSNKFAELKVVKFADVVASTAQGIVDELRAFELGPNSEVL